MRKSGEGVVLGDGRPEIRQASLKKTNGGGKYSRKRIPPTNVIVALPAFVWRKDVGKAWLAEGGEGGQAGPQTYGKSRGRGNKRKERCIKGSYPLIGRKERGGAFSNNPTGDWRIFAVRRTRKHRQGHN